MTLVLIVIVLTVMQADEMQLIMAALWYKTGYYIFALWLLNSSFFLFFLA